MPKITTATLLVLFGHLGCWGLPGAEGVAPAQTACAQAQADRADEGTRDASPATADRETGMGRHTVEVEKPWGTVRFHQGFPCSLVLKLGSQSDLLPGLSQEREFGSVEYRADDALYSTLNDVEMACSRDQDTIVFRGHLRNRTGAVSAHDATYSLTWTVSDLGFLRLDARLESRGGRFPGTVSYRFPFNGEQLRRYYHTGFQPGALRRESSLKKTPLDEISSPGTVFHFESDVIHRIIGFIRSETETLNFLPARGFFSELIVTNTPPAVVTYVDATPPSRGEVNASFYILPAPVRRHESLRRAFTAYFTKDRPLERPGGIASFLDTLSSYGCKEFIYHTWRFWNFSDTTTEVTCLARDPERLKTLIREAHQRGIDVILYMNLIPEETKTVWHRKHNAGRWRTEHPFSENMIGELWRRRDLMDLNSPFYEHRLGDLDYVFDTLGADGVFLDWFTPFAGSREHDFNQGIPTNNVNKLIDLIAYVKGKGKKVYLHSSEETRIPFLEDLADGFATGERQWDRVGPESTRSGLFDRWTTNRGNLRVILDSRMALSDAELRREVNWALLEGLNPFGYTYRVKWYGIGPNVRRQIAAGASESSFEYHDTYPLTLLEALRPYDLESMRLIPAGEAPATTGDSHVKVAAVTGPEAHILFVVNTDEVETRPVRVRCDRSRLAIDVEKAYRVVELTSGREMGNVLGEKLVRDGLSLEVPENTCLLLALLRQ